ncbi:MAG: acylphosphatase [Planctomycetes bacterium]|nr:acylphosphatase [Planctomycetota bacterium]
MKRISAQVIGRVQGVCYRYFCQSKANELGLSGWVKNQPDGSVLLEAQGEKALLEQFLCQLEMGPPLAKVSAIKQTDVPNQDGSQDFHITY